MDVNAYTLSLIDNYITATGLGEFRRTTLTPQEYLAFRKQAEEECKSGVVVTNIPSTPVLTPTPLSAPNPMKTVQKTNASAVAPAPKSTVNQADFDSFMEEEEDNMESLMRMVSG